MRCINFMEEIVIQLRKINMIQGHYELCDRLHKFIGKKVTAT
jgi:hypothetical protein